MNYDNTLWRPAETNLWQGRQDTPPLQALFQYIDVQPTAQVPAVENGIAIVGFVCDAGVKRNLGRPGASAGPDALRKQLAKLPWSTGPIIDAGNIHCENDDLEAAQQALGEHVAYLLQQGYQPLLLGGGHEIAWGHYQGLAAAGHAPGLGIINIDAHYDLRTCAENGKGSSGTPFWQIAQARQQQQLGFDYCCIGIQASANTTALFDTAAALKVTTIPANTVMHDHVDLSTFINGCQSLYLTICLDAFAASVAPGVSAPQPLGLTPHHVLPVLRDIMASGKVVSIDIAELAPKYDIDDHTARLGAQLLWYCHHGETNV